MAGPVPGELNSCFPAGIILSFSPKCTRKHELQQNWTWDLLVGEDIKLDLNPLNYILQLLL